VGTQALYTPTLAEYKNQTQEFGSVTLR